MAPTLGPLLVLSELMALGAEDEAAGEVDVVVASCVDNA